MFLFRETTTWCSETVAVSIGGCGLYFVLVPFWLKDEGAVPFGSFEDQRCLRSTGGDQRCLRSTVGDQRCLKGPACRLR